MSTVTHYGTLFPTAVVGSLPRPAFVRQVVMGERVLSAERRARVMDDAVVYAVRLQEEAGVDILSDGEWRRASYIGVIAELAHGFEVGRHEDGRPWTVVVDRLAPKGPGFLAAEARFLKQHTQKKIKVALPSPALLGERLWDPERSAGAYPTRRDFARACVPFLRRELELLAQAGTEVVQIDDPHLCLLVDPQVRAQHTDPDEEARYTVELINELVAGVKGVRLAVHLCRRAGARVRGEACHTGGYEPLIPHLNQLLVHHLTMEFTSPGAGEARVFARLREDLEIGLGCVSVHPGQVYTPEQIAARVEQALEFLPAERVVLNPDCGFAPGSAAVVDIEEVYTKLRNQSAAACLLRERHG
jgi:5-methyltetrahydropteroyltriglutamate--homocysteine methyltransferase